MWGVRGWERSGEHSSLLISQVMTPTQWVGHTYNPSRRDKDQEFKREEEASAQQVLRDRARQTRCQLPIPTFSGWGFDPAGRQQQPACLRLKAGGLGPMQPSQGSPLTCRSRSACNTRNVSSLQASSRTCLHGGHTVSKGCLPTIGQKSRQQPHVQQLQTQAQVPSWV